MSRVAVIQIPENDNEAITVASNDVSYYRIINVLQSLQTIYAQRIVKEAEKIVGTNPKIVEKYLDQQSKKHGVGISTFKLN